jgi:hypothetical protein
MNTGKWHRISEEITELDLRYNRVSTCLATVTSAHDRVCAITCTNSKLGIYKKKD